MSTVDNEPISKPAESAVPLHPLVARRWSPRALDPTAEITEDQLTALFEAARWAPSYGNTQPGRFIVGKRGEETFKRIQATLVPGNESWASRASVLIMGAAQVLSEDGEPFPYGEYGLGLAVQSMTAQAGAEGLVAHQMAGFDQDAAQSEFEIPAEFEALVVVAVGRQVRSGDIPEDLRRKELTPRTRKPLSELVFTGSWGSAAY